MKITIFILVAVWWGAACAQTLEFEVATVKLAAPAERGNCRGGPGSATPGQFTCVGGTVRSYIVRAWEVAPHELSAPSSTDDIKFNIVAKVPPNISRAEFNLMLQNLLKQRIGLSVHRESRTQTVYDLVVASSGLRMHLAEAKPASDAADPDGAAPARRLIRDKDGNQVLPPGIPAIVIGGMPGGLTHVMARVYGADQIARFIASGIEHQVTDKTGLTGKYDFTLTYAADKTATTSTTGPSLPEAVAEQLGLKLESKKGTVEVLVVDKFNKVPVE
jgi:uncharacterized protein (TIGR03435 family)